MRLSWVEPRLIQIGRAALVEHSSAWAEHFTPEFQSPPAPEGIEESEWPRIAEHIARAERVSEVVRNEGLEHSEKRFGGSTHAIEVATVIAAASQVGDVSFELLRSLLSCKVDEYIVYGEFLAMLVAVEAETDAILDVYQQFSDAVAKTETTATRWSDRVASVQDGLASFCIRSGHLDRGHAIFVQRFAEEPNDMTAALAASRSFLAAGAIARTVEWLGHSVERAVHLGRDKLASKLRDKQDAIRQRMS